MSYNKVELYGGAMTVDLPSNFADVSQIRQVPDNQEVYLDKDGLTSIVFDILERVDKPDLDALKYHLEDIVEDDVDATKLWTSNSAVFSKLPLQTSAYTLFATHKPSAEAVSRGKAPDFTGILLTLIRLESQQTDLVISVNVPHVGGDYNKDDVDPSAGKQGPMLDAATSFRDRILQTFEIKDWDLFVQE
ncbi:ran-interacting Mog1 protein [Aureobasidium pullulans EXF-150]|uniref:Ran-interacting Mog1 protein n=1 Tax=Aureobasidium pullulans EXF-150 TaxID=1043002 RepID=A0A074X8V6_AURPU|nr:ran-interacting Mog1 protein [Aureobasidium pullulans EXF-150]KEQ80129.1 ran-interacting Mog1 protein [Aureobasidium pullulans EXF-150]